MLMLISPAKTLDFEVQAPTEILSVPEFLSEAQELIQIMRGFDGPSLEKLMKISEKIAGLNIARYQGWQKATSIGKGKQALYAFKGDVYQGLEAESLSKTEQSRAQSSLRILSGLYGLLRPMDIIMPYRLEMGTKLQNSQGKDLYEFWRTSVTAQVNHDLESSKSKYLLNLASNEYFKAVNAKEVQAQVISPEFKDFKNGQFKIISFYAKKARGMMARYCISNAVSDEKALKQFDVGGYKYDNDSSAPGKPVFLRKQG